MATPKVAIDDQEVQALIDDINASASLLNFWRGRDFRTIERVDNHLLEYTTEGRLHSTRPLTGRAVAGLRVRAAKANHNVWMYIDIDAAQTAGKG